MSIFRNVLMFLPMPLSEIKPEVYVTVCSTFFTINFATFPLVKLACQCLFFYKTEFLPFGNLFHIEMAGA